MPPMSASDLFAVTAPGLESIALGELKRLGVKGKAGDGGVSYRGNAETMYATNLWLRTASRVVVRVARFHASTFHELERRARQVPWLEYLSANSAVSVRATCRKSRLYHSDAVAQRVIDSIARVAPGVTALESEPQAMDPDQDSAGEAQPEARVQLFIVRIVDDECEISADTSGELLHRRGYRLEVARAPLRETLAAAMLLASGWKAAEPLSDPMCGSGTIPIEAALLARGIAPGLHRRFAFMEWPAFEKATWERTLESASSTSRSAGSDLMITGADRDAGAIEAAGRNAERAGVGGDVRFAVRSLSASLHEIGTQDRPGWVLTNPPYGVRVGDPDGLRNLYAKLGSAVKSADGWRLGILTADTKLSRQMDIPMRARFSTSNGGIPVAFVAQEKTSISAADLRKRGVRGKVDGK
ncbi:MAG: class I SAM-dependent RNA methyltransferase [Gemmatimonadaceae bacterium]